MITRDEVLAILKNQLKIVKENLKEEEFNPALSFDEIGLDSLDSVNILFSMMKELKVKMLKDTFPKATSMNTIVDVFTAEKNRKS